MTQNLLSRKKICLVVTVPFTVRAFLLEHVRRLSEEYDVTVVTNLEENDFKDSTSEHIHFIHIPFRRTPDPLTDLRCLARLTVLFKKERFDSVHSITPKAGLLAMLASWFVRVPIRIHTFQGEVWVNRRGFWRAALRFMDKIVAWTATQLTVVSHSERQFLIDEGIISPSKSMVLAHGSICGVDMSRFHPDLNARDAIRLEIGVNADSMLLLFMGRLNREKGVLDLAEAFATIAAHNHDAILLIVGPDEGEILQDMRRRCASYDDRLKSIGYTPHPERYMAAADILCLPSYREGFGLVIIEAAACSVPAVASRIYGVTDAVEESVTGLLHEAHNSRDLAEKLSQLLQNPSQRLNMGIAGLARVKRLFAREQLTSAMLGMYRHLLEARYG
jgi:glycosyltransferase involved in cell wall biosynthesis